MKNRMVIIALLVLCTANAFAQQTESARPSTRQHTLMPVPAMVQFQTGRLNITAAFDIAIDGFTDDRLQGALFRMARRLEGRTGFEFKRATPKDAKAAALIIQCKGAGKAVPALDEDESYALTVADNQAV